MTDKCLELPRLADILTPRYGYHYFDDFWAFQGIANMGMILLSYQESGMNDNVLCKYCVQNSNATKSLLLKVGIIKENKYEILFIVRCRIWRTLPRQEVFAIISTYGRSQNTNI